MHGMRTHGMRSLSRSFSTHLALIWFELISACLVKETWIESPYVKEQVFLPTIPTLHQCCGELAKEIMFQGSS